MANHKKAKSFLSQLLLLSGVGLLVLSIPLALFGNAYLGQEARSNAQKDLQQGGNRFGIMLSAQFDEFLHLLEVSAESLQGIADPSAPHAPPQSIQQVRQLINALGKAYPGLLWIGLSNPEGRVMAAREGYLEGREVKARPWFIEGLKGPTVMDLHEAVLLAKLLPPRASGTYQFIDFSVPFRFQGSGQQAETSPVGVLGVHMDWEWLLEEIKRRQFGIDHTATEYLVLSKTGELRISTQQDWYTPALFGQLKAQLEAGNAAGHTPDTLDIQRNDGSTESYLFARISNREAPRLDALGWQVIALLPTSKMGQIINQSLILAILAMIAGSALTWMVLIQSARKLSRQAVGKLEKIARAESIEEEIQLTDLPRELSPIASKASELLSALHNKSTQLEQALAFSQAQYWIIGALVKQAPVPIAMLDQEGHYIACSARWNQEILEGIPHAENRPHAELLQDIPSAWKQAEQEAMLGKGSQAIDQRWIRHHGQIAYINWAIEPWRKPDGSLGGIVIMVEDVTYQHDIQSRLRESEERFKLAVEGLNDGLWDWEIDKREIYLSPNWKKMLGYTDEELPNSLRSWRERVHPEDRERVTAEFRLCINTPRHSQFAAEYRMQHRDGHWLHVLARARVLRDESGHAFRMVGSHVDRTQAIEMEDQLRDALVQARAEQEANRAKSQFVATVSHEIRNPLNGIMGFAHLLHTELPEGELKTNARYLMQTGESLSLILSELLDHAKMAAGQLSLQETPTRINELLEAVSALTRLSCESKGLSFSIETTIAHHLMILIDPGRVRQIIQNLLSNAVKFTQEGGVQLEAQLDPHGATQSQLRIRVKDSGMGVPENKREALFKPYSQLHSDPANTLGGTGLGLSIVRNLVELMDGTLHHHPNRPRGSVFEVCIPVDMCANTSSTESKHLSDESKASSPGHKRILVVDDSPFNLRILGTVLEKAGHQALTTSSGQEGLKLALAEPFDYLMIDMDIPDLNGLEIVQRLRASPNPNQKSLMACLSGRESEHDIQLALNSGFDFYFTKPLQFEDLLSSVHSIRVHSLVNVTK